MSKVEHKLNKNDINLLDLLKENQPTGLRVVTIIKLMDLTQRGIYRRLNVLEKIGLVINEYPIWKINPKKIKNLKIIKKGEGGLFFDIENKELIKCKKEKCYFCGHNKVLDYHHIIPISKGGSNKKLNILVLCPNCHTLLHRSKYSLIKMKYFWRMANEEGETILLPNNL